MTVGSALMVTLSNGSNVELTNPPSNNQFTKNIQPLQPVDTPTSAQPRPSLPPIVVRDVFGRRLDTETAHQKALNEARWRAAHRSRDTVVESEEWRLPGGPLPARPDLSRAAPPRVVTHDVLRQSHPPRGYGYSGRDQGEGAGVGSSQGAHPARLTQELIEKVRGLRKRSNSLPDLLDTVEESMRQEYFELGISLEKLSTLPPLEADAILRQSLQQLPNRKYIRLAHALPERSTDGLDLNDIGDLFSGFSYGYRRAGLCYGCEKGPGPHIHQDRPVRTGGGFTYYRRDVPVGPDPRKNPLRWKVFQRNDYTTEFRLPRLNDPGDVEGFHLAADKDEMELDSGRGRSITDGADTLRSDDSTFLAAGNRIQTRLPALEESLSPEEYEPGSKRGRLLKENLSGYLDLFHPVEASIAGQIDGSMETLKPPLQYIGKLYKGTQARDLRPGGTSHLEGGQESTGGLVHLSEGISGSVAPSEEVFRKPVLPKETKATDAEESDGEQFDTDTGAERTGRRKTKRREGLYKAPPAFKLKQTDRSATVGRSPFSDNRNINVPVSKGLDVKKSEKQTTKFIDGKSRPDQLWQEPTKFELTEREKKEMTPWIKPKSQESSKKQKRQEREEESPRPSSRDSGVEVQDQTYEEPEAEPEPKPDPEPELPKEAVPKVEAEPTPPPPPPPVVVKRGQQRRRVLEIREKVVTKQPERIPTPTPPTPTPPTPSPTSPPQVEEDAEEEGDYIRVDDYGSDFDRTELPPLPSARPPEPPEIPQWKQPAIPMREMIETELEIPPPMQEPQAVRRPVVPRVRRRPIRVERRPHFAPVTKRDLKEMANPLDYLAKYCIVHPDRLPLYEYVFHDVTSAQPYRFSDVPAPPVAPPDVGFADGTVVTTKFPPHEGASSPESGVADLEGNTKNFLTLHEKRMIEEFSLVNRQLSPDIGIGMNKGEEMVSKVNYTLDSMIDKYETLQNKLEHLEAERVIQLAELVKEHYPEVAKPGYVPVVKKTKKNKKKKKGVDKPQTKGVSFPEEDQDVEAAGETGKVTEPSRSKPKQPTDGDIVNRLNQKQMQNVMNHNSVHQINMEIDRLREKLRQTDDRIEDLEDEKRLLQLYSRDEFLSEQTAQARPSTFMRKQSNLYQKFHPQVDVAMNLNELEDALQQVNGQLMTEKEMQFVYHILDLPGRRKINMQLFGLVAALSEKVTQVEPLIKKLINKFDFEALSVKMDRCKELFYLLDEQDVNVPDGMVTVNSLIVELMAGGVSPENTHYVLQKFNREKKGVIDFLDFLTYVPLFIEIHERIINDPLSQDRNL